MPASDECVIHPTAVIDAKAQLGKGVHVGAYSVIGADVMIGDNTKIASHVVISGPTEIGPDCDIHSFTILGDTPQHTKYAGEDTKLIIGARNIIREHVTMHRGTVLDEGVTQIGSDSFFMVGTHVAHDCVIGDHAILANGVGLAGHVKAGDHVYFGGYCAIHPFVKIGSQAIIGAKSTVVEDVIPYGAVVGEHASLQGLNVIGLKRRGFSKSEVQDLRKGYKILFEDAEGVFQTRLEDMRADPATSKPMYDILDFITSERKRPLCHPVLEAQKKA